MWRSALRQPRYRVLLAAILAGVLVVSGMLVYHFGFSGKGKVTASSNVVSAEVRPGASQVLALPGVKLTVPAGAVNSPVRARLALGGDYPVAVLPAETAKLLQAASGAVEITLDGRQPLVPLTLELAAFGPGQSAPKSLVVVSKHNEQPLSIAGTYNAATHAYTVSVSQLSTFQLVWVDPGRVVQAAKDLIGGMLNVVGIKGKKPDCAGKSAQLANGDKVRVSGLNDAQQMWPCVAIEGNSIKMTMHSALATLWRVRTSGGSYDGAAEPETGNAVVQAIYQVMVKDRRFNDGLIVSQGTGVWTMQPDDLPVNVAAKLSGGAWFAQVGVFTAVFLADVFSGGTGKAAEVARRFSETVGDKAAGWDCVVKAAEAAPDGVAVTPDKVVAITKAAIACAGPLFKVMFGAGISALGGVILGILGSGIAVVWGGLEVSFRNLLSLFRPEATLMMWQIQLTQALSSCPSASEFLRTVNSQLGNQGSVKVSGGVVCQSGWAAAAISNINPDPVSPENLYVVMRQQGNAWRVVDSGTEGWLLDTGKPVCGQAPPKVKARICI